jgi:hypothetical protein
MPGTVRLELYNMPLAEALAILAIDADFLTGLGVSAADVDELRRAARWVVERHAEEVALRYVSPSSGASQPGFLRVVANGGVQDGV